MSWGAGDFTGGVATRVQNQFQVLYVSAVPGIIVLAILALILGEAVPARIDVFWALCAGVCGAFGIAALYKGLSMGNAATVAPVAAVIGAGLPVIFSCIHIGVPGLLHMIGFISAIFGIWLVSRPVDGKAGADSFSLLMAVIAGTGFGFFFILIAQVRDGYVFGPLVITKGVAVIIALILIFIQRGKVPSLDSNPVAVYAGLFDAGGNVFFMIAKQFTRLDVAAVLASMYPCATIILACLINKEKVSVLQWQGVVLCLTAIALIGI